MPTAAPPAPEARLGHFGVYRDEATLTPVSYYRKLPPDVASTEVLLIDPMLATGGSALAAVDYSRPPASHRCASCACRSAGGDPGLARTARRSRLLRRGDRQLNEKGYILRLVMRATGFWDVGEAIKCSQQLDKASLPAVHGA